MDDVIVMAMDCIYGLYTAVPVASLIISLTCPLGQDGRREWPLSGGWRVRSETDK